MPVPKRRTSSHKRDTRRAHDHLTPPNVIECANCGSRTLSHHACPSCGHYKGRQVVDTVGS